MITAVTFDFWDTLAIDDSDEPKRAARGLPSKAEARLQLLTEEINRHHPRIQPERIAQALAAANERFGRRWKVDRVTPTVAQRLQVAYDRLAIDRTPGFDGVVRDIEDMEVRIPPDFVPGAQAALAELAGECALGIISDTIHTPGRGLRQLLADQGLLQHFKCCVFSDELGASKPAPQTYRAAAAGLGVPLDRIAHVGDRETNDVEGPLALGMRAILFIGAIDRGSAATQAQAVCANLADLPRIVRSLNADGGQ